MQCCDPDCDLSPAQIVFGRPLHDALNFINHLGKLSNPNVRQLWREAWSVKEEALRTRITCTSKSLRAHSKPPQPLSTGVFLQNQQGTHPKKWDRSGVVVESTGHDQYRVKIDGSGWLTLRNRRFLRAYTPETSSKPRPQVTAPAPTTSDAPQPANLCPQDPNQQDEGSVQNPAPPPMPVTPCDSSPDPAEPDQATAPVDVRVVVDLYHRCQNKDLILHRGANTLHYVCKNCKPK